MAELHEVEEWLGALLAQLEPTARKKMLREVARDVRRIQQQNMTAQRAPDGTAWEPRRITARTKPGRIRRKMFAKLKTAKYLKGQATANEALISFVPAVQHLAQEHHYGLSERAINDRSNIKYPQRKLLGFDKNFEGCISDIVAKYFHF